MLHRAGVLCALSLCAAAAPQSAADLVGHWPMDTVAANATPSAVGGGDLNLVNGGTLVAGRFGNGIDLDGTNDHLTTPSTAALNFGTGSFTIALYARPDTTNSHRLVNKWDGPAQQGFLLDVHSGTGGSAVANNLRFRLDSSTAGNTATDNVDVTEPAGLGSGTWKHLAVVVDRGATPQIRLYVDGAQVGAGTAIPAGFGSVSNTFDLGVGTIPSAAGKYFDGAVDDLRFYNRALTLTEIQTLRDGIPGPGQPTATPGPTEITVSWPAFSGATSYTLYVSTGGPFSALTTTAALSYTHTGLDPTTTYTYHVTAEMPLGHSQPSPDESANPLPPPPPPPRTNDHSEGLFDDRCACGSSAAPMPWLPALLGVLALAGAFRRR